MFGFFFFQSKLRNNLIAIIDFTDFVGFKILTRMKRDLNSSKVPNKKEVLSWSTSKENFIKFK